MAGGGAGIRTPEEAACDESSEFADRSLAEAQRVNVVRSDASLCNTVNRCDDENPAASFRRVEHTFLARKPATITCPNCLTCVTTVVRRLNQPITHWTALGLTAICLCFLPYFSDVLRDTIHYCPCCNIYLGIKFASLHDAEEACTSYFNVFFDQGPNHNLGT